MMPHKKIEDALKHYQEGDVEKAAGICKEIVSNNHRDIEGLQLLAVISYQLQDYDLSLSYTQRLLELVPDDFYACFHMGNILLHKGILEESIVHFTKAIDLNPSFGDAHYNLAVILEKTDRFEEAVASYKKALTINPDMIDVYNNLGSLLLKISNFDEAIPYLRKAIQMNPDYALALNNLGIALKEKSCLDEAIIHLQKALELEPSFYNVYYNLGTALEAAGRIDEAISHYKKSIALNPDFSPAYYNLGFALIDKGMHAEAISVVERALMSDPGDPRACRVLKSVLCPKIPRNLKFNIMISKRHRNESLLTCLHYLNLSNADRIHDVEIHISHDDGEVLDCCNFQNIKVSFHPVEGKNKFNKSRLLNNSIMNAMRDWDILTIIDLDMVYQESFFDLMAYLISQYDYVVSFGAKLTEKDSKKITESLPPLSRIKKLQKESMDSASQISLNKKAFVGIIRAAGREQLYNEYFEGWGCEDSEISAIAIHLEKKGIIKKALVDGMWYHLWHQNACETDCFDKEIYKKNVAYLENIIKNLI